MKDFWNIVIAILLTKKVRLTSSLQPPLQPWDAQPLALVQQLTSCCGESASVLVCEVPPILIKYMLSITSAAVNAQQEPERRLYIKHHYENCESEVVSKDVFLTALALVLDSSYIASRDPVDSGGPYRRC